MTAYHDVKFGGLRIQVDGLEIVQHVNIHCSCFGHGRFRERFRPVRSIHVSADRYHWSNVGERFQYARIAYVTGMNDQI